MIIEAVKNTIFHGMYDLRENILLEMMELLNVKTNHGSSNEIDELIQEDAQKMPQTCIASDTFKVSEGQMSESQLMVHGQYISKIKLNIDDQNTLSHTSNVVTSRLSEGQLLEQQSMIQMRKFKWNSEFPTVNVISPLMFLIYRNYILKRQCSYLFKKIVHLKDFLVDKPLNSFSLELYLEDYLKSKKGQVKRRGLEYRVSRLSSNSNAYR
jgi:hypothetical protein